MVVSTEYYDLLNVSVDSDDETVRRGYLKQARKWHPDKNGGDPNAETRFKAIGVAYKVLSDKNLRQIYDEKGKEKADQANNAAQVDPIEQTTELCRSLFGFGKFDTVFGDPTTLSLFLMALKLISQSQDKGTSLDATEEVKRQLEQQERDEAEAKEQAIVDELCLMLKKKLNNLAKGQEHKQFFHEMVLLEAESLSDSPGGDELVGITGYIYQQEAKQHMGRYFGFEGLWSEIAEQGHLLSQRMDLISQGIKLFRTSARLQNIVEAKKSVAGAGAESIRDSAEHSNWETRTKKDKTNTEYGSGAHGDTEGGEDEYMNTNGTDNNNNNTDRTKVPGGQKGFNKGFHEGVDMELEQERIMFEAVLSHGLSAMWKLGKYLVEERLRKVCELLLSDPLASQEQIDMWAEGLLQMGVAYSEVSQKKQSFHTQTGASDSAQERYGLPKFR
ncbi:hypothetical protein SARC_10910 [Sphaeroforma arctica JP610]|uniref:J domain-containing protein n=1 Tax=Sphaeroforma arctica JP610 TaxID=667725 RepID=A0A0L0FIK3_9EUKA|nr:hypothetical protein SARC_10910 [Sphaeroforma arctica JP610]KNC76599.1 hypothetical protein SARC_10910 [Sphaeroforma arctica JP610]|eukprot:XP_014150501.1 hypothetical protein SARC_10910 [Sphaeroforma arctica JP610]